MSGGGIELFGNMAGRNQIKSLVEFRAGKMFMRGKMVYPDKRKGLLFIHQSDDALIHFCWKNRTSGDVEDDLIIFPDDCEFKFVPQCTTGRVYVLKFKLTQTKSFFWLQEPKTDKDEENCRRINEIMNNPPTPASNRSGKTTPEDEFKSVFSTMSQKQLMQLFGGVRQIGGLSSMLGTMSQTGRSSSATRSSSILALNTSSSTDANAGSSRSTSISSPPPPPPNSTSSGSASSENQEQKSATGIQLKDLQSMLSVLTGAQGTTTTDKPPGDLSVAMDVDNLQDVIENSQATDQLAQHLPAAEIASEDSTPITQSTPDSLKDTIASPQQTGQLGSVVQQFDMGEGAVSAANQGNMKECVNALQQANIKAEKSDDARSTSPEKHEKPENNDIGSN